MNYLFILYWLCSIGILFAFPRFTLAQQNSPKTFPVTSDICYVATEPLRWNRNDLGNVVMVAGATSFLMVYDERINEFVSVNKNQSVSDFNRYVLSPWGNGVYSLPLLGALYLSGTLTKNNYDREMSLLGVRTFLVSAGGATLLKIVLNRDRPGDSRPPDAFQFRGPFDSPDDDGSMVSRHAAVAFALAAVMSDGYRRQHRWVPYVAYSLAGLVTCSRVYDRKHWTSDAFSGAALGFVTGKFMFKIHEKRKAPALNILN
jgi:membrane-associated phospholipid phosphatase